MDYEPEKSEVINIIELLQLTFEGEPWHGPSVMKIFSELDDEDMSKHIGTGHTILELIYHMIIWRQVVTHRILGTTPPPTDVLDWRKFNESHTLDAALKELKQTQNELMDALEIFEDTRLKERFREDAHDFYTMIHGLIHHDLYHLGQISMLKKYG